MRDEFLPFSPPDITEAEVAEVVAAVRSGWITTGPSTARFETTSQQVLALPLFSAMREEDVEEVTSRILDAVDGV